MKHLKGSVGGPTKHTDVGAEPVWEYASPGHASAIGAESEAGEYVYAPPAHASVQLADGRTEMRLVAPELEPLRQVLSGRGLALHEEGAYYWLVVKAPIGPIRRGGPRCS